MYAATPKPKTMREQRHFLLRDVSLGALASHTCASVLTPAMIGVNAVNELWAREGQKRLAETEAAISPPALRLV